MRQTARGQPDLSKISPIDKVGPTLTLSQTPVKGSVEEAAQVLADLDTTDTTDPRHVIYNDSTTPSSQALSTEASNSANTTASASASAAAGGWFLSASVTVQQALLSRARAHCGTAARHSAQLRLEVSGPRL